MNSKTHFAALMILGAFGYAWAARNDVLPMIGNFKLPTLATPPSDTLDPADQSGSDLQALIAQWNARNGVVPLGDVTLQPAGLQHMPQLGEPSVVLENSFNGNGLYSESLSEPVISFGDQLEDLTSTPDLKKTPASQTGFSESELTRARQMAELLGLPLETFLASRHEQAPKQQPARTPQFQQPEQVTQQQKVPNPFLKPKRPQSALDLLKQDSGSEKPAVSFDAPIQQPPRQPAISQKLSGEQPVVTQQTQPGPVKHNPNPQQSQPPVITQREPVVPPLQFTPPSTHSWVRPITPLGRTDAPRFVPQPAEIEQLPPRMSFKPSRTLKPGALHSELADSSIEQSTSPSTTTPSTTHSVNTQQNVTERWKSSDQPQQKRQTVEMSQRPDVPWTSAFLSSAGRPFQTYAHAGGTKRVLVIGSLDGMDQSAIELMDALKNEVAFRKRDLKDWSVLIVKTGNPDGYTMQRQGNSRGVDLETNFPGHVSAIRGKTVATANAEVETRMLMQIFQQYRPDRVIFVRNHPDDVHEVIFSSTEERFACLLSAPGPYQLTTNDQWNAGSAEQYARHSMGADVVAVDLSGRVDAVTLWNENALLLWNAMTSVWTQGVPSTKPMPESNENVANSFEVEMLPSPHSKAQLASALDTGDVEIVPETTQEVVSPVQSNVVELLPKPSRNSSKSTDVILLPKPKRNAGIVRP